MTHKNTAALLCVANLILLAPAQTHAQGEGGGNRSRLIEEVVVTAQKRQENIKDVPITISAYSAEKLNALSVVDSGDLPRLAPGLTINNRIGFATTFLRGVGSNAFLLGDPLVVTYIDGVYFPFAGGQVQNLGAVERVEVLKGPQGTLFGRNALGGAISIKTRDPSLEDAQFSGQASYSSRYKAHNLRAYLSAPLTDALAVSLSGFDDGSDSYRDGQLNDGGVLRDLPRVESHGIRGKVLFEPVEWFSSQLSYYETWQESAETYAVNTEPSAIGQLLGMRAQDPYRGANNDAALIDGNTRTIAGQMAFYLDWFDVKLFGSQQDVEFITDYDFDGTDIAIATFGSRGTADTKTAELQILSNDSAPAWLEWIVGAYYFDSLAGIRDAYLRAGGVNLAEGELAGIQLPTPLLGVLQTVASVFPADQLTVGLDGVLDTESMAFYTQATFDLTDWASLTVGARYQEEDRILAQSTVGPQDDNGDYLLLLQSFEGYSDPNYRDTTRSLDPKISLNIRPDWQWLGDQPLVYLSYQTATTSSTFNTLNITDEPEKVKSTEIAAYELGIKTRFLDGLVDFNGAIFHYEIDNPQVQVISLLAGGAVSFENAEAQKIDGVEFDTTIQVFPSLVDNLIVTASGAWLDAIYSSFKNGSGFNDATGLFTEGAFDHTGNKIAGSPEFSGNLGILKSIFIQSGSLELGLNAYYSDETYALAQNIEQSRIDAYTTVGANVSYLHDPWGLRVTLFGTNILDEEYKTSRFVTDFGPNDGVGPRSTYGLRFNYDFN